MPPFFSYAHENPHFSVTEAVYGPTEIPQRQFPPFRLTSHELAFSGGDGTSERPYLIATPEDLSQIRLVIAAAEDESLELQQNLHFRQTAPIDLGQSPWNEGVGWEPIGNSAFPFRGHYDGAHYPITGLTIQQPIHSGAGTSHVGLFGVMTGGSLKRLHLENATVQGYDQVGALLGKGTGVEVIQVRVSGSVTGRRNVGGLAGQLIDGEIQNSTASVTFAGERSAGGLVGLVSNTHLSQCSTFVTGEAIHVLGGIAGHAEANTSIMDSFCRGTLRGSSRWIGGAVGFLENSHVNSSYVVVHLPPSTDILADNPTFRGFVGHKGGASSVISSFYDQPFSGRSLYLNELGTGRTTTQMKRIATFTTALTSNGMPSWNFESVWGLDSLINDGYPYLKALEAIPLPEPPPEPAPEPEPVPDPEPEPVPDPEPEPVPEPDPDEGEDPEPDPPAPDPSHPEPDPGQPDDDTRPSPTPEPDPDVQPNPDDSGTPPEKPNDSNDRDDSSDHPGNTGRGSRTSKGTRHQEKADEILSLETTEPTPLVFSSLSSTERRVLALQSFQSPSPMLALMTNALLAVEELKEYWLNSFMQAHFSGEKH
ncbi:GLUG motif-containing protein [Anoxynatronum sibiricum]